MALRLSAAMALVKVEYSKGLVLLKSYRKTTIFQESIAMDLIYNFHLSPGVSLNPIRRTRQVASPKEHPFITTDRKLGASR